MNKNRPEGGGSYLQDKFGFDKNEARKVLIYWMETFGNDDR